MTYFIDTRIRISQCFVSPLLKLNGYFLFHYLTEYFIHMSSVTTDNTATITKQNIHGTSYDQYLSLSYHVTGIGSKITVSLHGGINTSVLWSSVDSSQLVINEWKSATMNITTFEKYEVPGCKFVIIFNKSTRMYKNWNVYKSTIGMFFNILV